MVGGSWSERLLQGWNEVTGTVTHRERITGRSEHAHNRIERSSSRKLGVLDGQRASHERRPIEVPFMET